jgi:hypothetical protein
MPLNGNIVHMTLSAAAEKLDDIDKQPAQVMTSQ